MATIHQPSAQIFNLFDRVILLSNGHQILQCSTSTVSSFLNEQYGIQLGRYVNPADALLKLANCPEKFGTGISLQDLYKAERQVVLSQTAMYGLRVS